MGSLYVQLRFIGMPIGCARTGVCTHIYTHTHTLEGASLRFPFAAMLADAQMRDQHREVIE